MFFCENQFGVNYQNLKKNFFKAHFSWQLWRITESLMAQTKQGLQLIQREAERQTLKVTSVVITENRHAFQWNANRPRSWSLPLIDAGLYPMVAWGRMVRGGYPMMAWDRDPSVNRVTRTTENITFPQPFDGIFEN